MTTLRVAFGEQSIELCEWSTEAEMQEHLQKCEVGTILLRGRENAVRYDSVTIRPAWSPNNRLGVGIVSDVAGVTPQLLVESTTKCLLIGYNSDVACLNAAQRTVTNRVHLGSPFGVFVSHHDLRLAFHEIGVVALADDGRERWRWSQDIVVNARIEGERLALTLMDAPGVQLDLLSGQIITESK